MILANPNDSPIEKNVHILKGIGKEKRASKEFSGSQRRP